VRSTHNVVLEQHRRQRWSTVAQSIMFEFIKSARMIWSGILEVAGLVPDQMNQSDSVDAGVAIVHNTARLTGAIRQVLGDPERRKQLYDEVAFLAEHTDEVLGRWAGVMLNVEVYAEVVNRHVEMVGDIAWIAGLPDTSRPPKDSARRRPLRTAPGL